MIHPNQFQCTVPREIPGTKFGGPDQVSRYPSSTVLIFCFQIVEAHGIGCRGLTDCNNQHGMDLEGGASDFSIIVEQGVPYGE